MSISHNVAFAVNLEEVGGLGDLKADEMGVWDRQGAGRKGGVPKRKRTKKPAKIETRSKRTNVSVQPTAVCPPPLLATTVIASSPVTIATPSTPPILSQTTALSMNAAQQAYPYSHGGSPYSSNTQQTTSSFAASRMQSPLSVCFPIQVPRLPPPLLSIHQSPGTSHASCYSWYSPTANPFPWRPQLLSTVASHHMQLQTNHKPFFVKFLTRQIKVCQGCRKQFHDENTDPPLDVIVARLERRVISNPSTGDQMLTKESPSHYHPKLSCIRMVCPSFCKTNLVVPPELSLRLTAVHKAYLDNSLKDWTDKHSLTFVSAMFWPAFVVLQVILVMFRIWLGGMTPIINNPMYVVVGKNCR